MQTNEYYDLITSRTLFILPLWELNVVPVHSLDLPEGEELKLDLDTLARIWCVIRFFQLLLLIMASFASCPL